MLAELAQFTATPGCGVTRLPFTPEAAQAADYLLHRMQEAGMDVKIDSSGAVIGTLPGGSNREFVIASHYDSVVHGGAYDGIAGVVCGIEIARQFARGELPFALRVIATNDEEGARFGSGFFSSRAFLGLHSVRELKKTCDRNGVSTYDAMKQAGFVPETIGQCVWNLSRVLAFVEIHIEQGPVLETEQADLGIVTGIVGMKRRMVHIYGQAGHAGTTPMHLRRDAVEIAAHIICRIGDIARRYPGAVATVGHIEASPNDINTIAGMASFSVDIRSLDARAVDAIDRHILQYIKMTCESMDGAYDTVLTLDQPPAPMDEALRRRLQHACVHCKVPKVLDLPSGAGHDSLAMAGKVPTAMLFVPSHNGRSHCPEEQTDAEALVTACKVVHDVLYHFMEE